MGRSVVVLVLVRRVDAQRLCCLLGIRKVHLGPVIMQEHKIKWQQPLDVAIVVCSCVWSRVKDSTLAGRGCGARRHGDVYGWRGKQGVQKLMVPF